jgi:hypothetical protein
VSRASYVTSLVPVEFLAVVPVLILLVSFISIQHEERQHTKFDSLVRCRGDSGSR